MRLNSEILKEFIWISYLFYCFIAGQHDLNSSYISDHTLNDSTFNFAIFTLVDFFS